MQATLCPGHSGDSGTNGLAWWLGPTALGLEQMSIRAAWHRLWGWVHCTLPTPVPTASALDSDAGVIPAGPASLDTFDVF